MSAPPHQHLGQVGADRAARVSDILLLPPLASGRDRLDKPPDRRIRPKLFHQPHDAVLPLSAALLAFYAQHLELAGDIRERRHAVACHEWLI